MQLLFFVFIVNFSIAQQTQYVDFLTCNADITVLPIKKVVSGTVGYTFKITKAVDSIYIDAKNMKFSNVFLKNRKAVYKNTDTKLWLFFNFKKGKEYAVSFNYEAHPKKAMYFIDWEYQKHPEANPQVWTQGQGKDNSNWIPSFDDMNEKLAFDLSITFDEKYQVITNGKFISKKRKRSSGYTWKFDMKQPMSSYLLAIAIGKYDKQTVFSKHGIPLELYYYPKDKAKIESTYRYTKQMFDFLEEEIGVPYPWQNYKQVPVKDFLYAGMENTSITIFSDAFVIDSTSFVDKNYVNVNAHELAHQWFGDLVTETHGTHHWLQEGFATYYSLLAEKEVFGNDYYYHKLYNTSKQLINAQKTDTIPLMNSKASSLTFYQKGAWALHSLREQIGDSIFKLSVKKYLQKHQFKNVETNDFIRIVETESKQNLSEFVNTWLLSNKFKTNYSSAILDKINKDSVFYELIQANKTDSLSVANWSIRNKDLKIRQVFSEKLQKIPAAYKLEYEGLLNDKSYKTIEIALLNLWLNFPESRKKYLDKTENIVGFNDKNIKTLWLTLALNTKGFAREKYKEFYEELVEYTYPAYHFEVRKNAFQYLNKLNLVDSTVLQNLQQATTHHNWRFRSYCKKLFTALIKDE